VSTAQSDIFLLTLTNRSSSLRQHHPTTTQPSADETSQEASVAVCLPLAKAFKEWLTAKNPALITQIVAVQAPQPMKARG
jgi:hypothetical protein